MVGGASRVAGTPPVVCDAQQGGSSVSDRESQFPKRLRGIWRAGALRASDSEPGPTVLGSSARRRERYREQRRETPGGGLAGTVMATLAERLRERVEQAATDAAQAQQRQGESPDPARKPARSGRRHRRGGLGAFIRSLIVLGFFAFLFTRMFGIDVERLLQELTGLIEQTLSGERPHEPARQSGAAAPATTGPAGGPLVRNGSFESPALAGVSDTTLPAAWEFAGERPYARLRGNTDGYPPAPDGVAILAVHGEGRGTLYQNLVPMEAGVTYTFRAVVLHGAGANAYRAALWRVEQKRQRELAFVSDKQVSPPQHDGFKVTFSYTASDDDAGTLLRLQLSDNGSRRKTRSAFDAVEVNAERQ